MMRGPQKAGGILVLLTGALVVGLWWASVREEPLPPAASSREASPASPGDGGGAEAAQLEKDEYARKALETLRAAGFTDPLRYDPERFHIQIPDAQGQQAQTIFLGNLYEEYRATPPERRDRVLRKITAIGRAPEFPISYAAARTALLPAVRPRTSFSLLEILDLDSPLNTPRPTEWRPLGEVLAVAIVLDTPDAMKYLGQQHFQEWGVTFDEALGAAMENLRSQSSEPLIPVAPGVCASAWRDSYAASRMLLDEVLRRCKVRGDPVVFVPHRDLLLITGSEDEDGLLRAAEIAQESLQAPRPIDGRALRRTPQGWRPFLPSPPSKAWLAMRKLAVYSQARDYADQRDQLRQHHEQLGVDLFVADFVLSEDEQGRVVSQAVWVKGIDTLLPRVDRIFFMDSELGPEAPPVAVVRWEAVERDMGAQLLPVEGDYPVRYRPQSFPSPEQIARWKKDPSAMDVPSPLP
ncbi:hypothetical protein [Hyalangium sp.]|uniref:hypothetical protein n=1 Tax=Hyalangium sp. TaxID=2028555 RepID=UPI002D376708|nr:hypothetical protein [Hyalangium sp.]HYH99607.1 hypothetical protein [Hyalangium sp.]